LFALSQCGLKGCEAGGEIVKVVGCFFCGFCEGEDSAAGGVVEEVANLRVLDLWARALKDGVPVVRDQRLVRCPFAI
jgi:hypothetical protein